MIGSSGPATPGAWLPLDRVAEAARRATGRAAAPFHLSHRARRIDAREPAARRDRSGAVAARAAAAADARRSPRRAGPSGVAAERRAVRRGSRRVLPLWSRGYAATRSVVVKATSSAGRIAAIASDGTPARARSTSTWTPSPTWPRCWRGRIRRSTCAGMDPNASGVCSRGWRNLSRRCTLCRSASWRRMSWLAESRSRAKRSRGFPIASSRSTSTPSSRASPRAWNASSAISGCPPMRGICRTSAAARCSRAIRRRPNTRIHRKCGRRSCARRAATIATRSGKGLAWLERLARANAAVAEVCSTAA